MREREREREKERKAKNDDHQLMNKKLKRHLGEAQKNVKMRSQDRKEK